MANVKDVVAAINFIYKENNNPDDCYIKESKHYIDLYVNGRLHASTTENMIKCLKRDGSIE